MHYALCIFTMFFLCILQFRGSIQCIIQNMQYEVMRYENFDCSRYCIENSIRSASTTPSNVAHPDPHDMEQPFERAFMQYPSSDKSYAFLIASRP